MSTLQLWSLLRRVPAEAMPSTTIHKSSASASVRTTFVENGCSVAVNPVVQLSEAQSIRPSNHISCTIHKLGQRIYPSFHGLDNEDKAYRGPQSKQGPEPRKNTVLMTRHRSGYTEGRSVARQMPYLTRLGCSRPVLLRSCWPKCKRVTCVLQAARYSCARASKVNGYWTDRITSSSKATSTARRLAHEISSGGIGEIHRFSTWVATIAQWRDGL